MHHAPLHVRELVILKGRPGPSRTAVSRLWLRDDTWRARVSHEDLRLLLFDDKWIPDGIICAVGLAITRRLLTVGFSVLVDNRHMNDHMFDAFAGLVGKVHNTVLSVKDFSAADCFDLVTGPQRTLRNPS